MLLKLIIEGPNLMKPMQGHRQWRRHDGNFPRTKMPAKSHRFDQSRPNKKGKHLCNMTQACNVGAAALPTLAFIWVVWIFLILFGSLCPVQLFLKSYCDGNYASNTEMFALFMFDLCSVHWCFLSGFAIPSKAKYGKYGIWSKKMVITAYDQKKRSLRVKAKMIKKFWSYGVTGIYIYTYYMLSNPSDSPTSPMHQKCQT